MRGMRNWIWGLIALIAIAGCEPEPEGQVLRVPTADQARELEQKQQQDKAFQPGIYSGTTPVGTGDVSIRAEFRADKEATISRNLTGAKPKVEIMKGSYRVVDNIVEVTITEVNGETSTFPLFFFEEVNGVSTQDIAEGAAVRVFLTRILDGTEDSTPKPPANTPATPPPANIPPKSPSSGPSDPEISVMPLADNSPREGQRGSRSPDHAGPHFEGV